jgi:ATP-dependent RNA helicase RhlE
LGGLSRYSLQRLAQPFKRLCCGVSAAIVAAHPTSGGIITMTNTISYSPTYRIALHAVLFTEYSFHPSLQEGLDAMNFTQPTPIQEQAIPVILQGQDLLACAQTGTGKTAAFLLPILHKLAVGDVQTTNTLIIVPTRELALQIDQAIQGFSYFSGVSSIAIYGGNDGIAFATEKVALTEGANIIVATPGRLKAHLNMGYVKFDSVQHFILDEADKMLDMGFVDDINLISNFLPKKKQTLLFSATMPQAIRTLAQRLLTNPHEISIAISKPAAGVEQKAYSVYASQKISMVKAILMGRNDQLILIFTSTKKAAAELNIELQRSGIASNAIHSDLVQAEREQVLMQFRARKVPVLVATDILSRGIDIDNINLVINYDLPGDAEDYVHRVGRTARANTTGVAITLITPADQRKFHQIEQLIEREVPKGKVPSHLGEAPVYDPSKAVSAPPRGGRGSFKGKRR